MSTRSNGGIIGPQNRTTSAFANGVWHLYDNQQSVLSRNWPGFIPTVPGPPNLSNVTFGTGTQAAYLTATIPFSLNVNNGGNAVTSVTAVSIPGGLSASTAGTSPITIANLTANTNYVFQVYETNYYGNSPVVFTNPATTAGVPAAPTIGTATLVGSNVNVAYTTNSNGGAPITSVTAISTPGNVTATGTSSPILVTGLGSNTSYTFKVYATNVMGNSDLSAASNSVTTPVTSTINYLVVGGGGGGGGGGAGGGAGAGGYIANSVTLATGIVLSISAGGGGSGSSGGTSYGGNGSPSTITGTGVSVSALPGTGAVYNGPPHGANGVNGSGDGAAAYGSGTTSGGSGTPGQGFNGGGTTINNNQAAGGGGGGGAVGVTSSGTVAGNGGIGIISTLITAAQATSANIGQVSGGNVYFCGGGGGGAWTDSSGTGGTGGLGGGGSTPVYPGFSGGKPGLANSGGGGSGANTNSAVTTAGAGGSGVVILSIPTASYTGTYTGSPTVVTNGSNTVLIFKGTGTYTT